MLKKMSIPKNIENDLNNKNDLNDEECTNSENKIRKDVKNFLKQQNDILVTFTKEQEDVIPEFTKKNDKISLEFFGNDNRLNEFISYIFYFKTLNKPGYDSVISKILTFSIYELRADGINVHSYSSPYDKSKPIIDLTFKLTKENFGKQISDLYIKNIVNPEILNEYLRNKNLEHFYVNYHENDKNILDHFTQDEIRFYLPLCFNYTYDPEYVQQDFSYQPSVIKKNTKSKSFWTLF